MGSRGGNAPSGTQNRYLYCDGNSVGYIDINGMWKVNPAGGYTSGWVGRVGNRFRMTMYYGPWACRQDFIDDCKENLCKKKAGTLGGSGKYIGCVWVADFVFESESTFLRMVIKAGGRWAFYHCCCDCPKISAAAGRKKWDEWRERYRKDWEEDHKLPWPKEDDGPNWPGHHVDPLESGGDPTDPLNVIPIPPGKHVAVHKAYRECDKGLGGWEAPGVEYPYKHDPL